MNARDRLARWLADEDAATRGAESYTDTSWACVRGRWLAKADRLLPVVDALCAERAAEELRAAADEVGVPAYWRRRLTARAAALAEADR